MDRTLCGWVQARLFDYMDRELDATEQRKMQAHLENCSFCQAELRQSRQSEMALANALAAVPSPGDLSAGFYARLAASQAPRRPVFAGWRLAVPALAVCLLGLVLWRTHAGSPVSIGPPPAVSTKPPGNVMEMPGPAADTEAFSAALPLFPPDVAGVRALVPGKETLSHPTASLPHHEMAFEKRRTDRTPARLHKPARRSDPDVTRGMDGSIALAMKVDLARPIAPEEDFHLTVQDDMRGFKASAHLASYTTQKDDAEVVTIQTEGDTIVMETMPTQAQPNP